MIDEEPDKTDTDPLKTGEGFVRTSSNYRTSERTRRMVDDIRKRSAEIRIEAERIRSLSMITLLNADMNFRAARKAHRITVESAKPRGPKAGLPPEGPEGDKT